jgi:hypothetical protein
MSAVIAATFCRDDAEGPPQGNADRRQNGLCGRPGATKLNKTLYRRFVVTGARRSPPSRSTQCCYINVVRPLLPLCMCWRPSACRWPLLLLVCPSCAQCEVAKLRVNSRTSERQLCEVQFNLPDDRSWPESTSSPVELLTSADRWNAGARNAFALPYIRIYNK